MTLWLDSGVVRNQYVNINDKEAMAVRERLEEGRAYVDVEIPAGVEFSVDIQEFINQFRGSNPDVDISSVLGTVSVIEGPYEKKMVFSPNRDCTVTFSTDESAKSSSFEKN